MAQQRVGIALLVLAVFVGTAQAAAPKCTPACVNGGVCSQSEDDITYCKCPTGFWGETCAAKYVECKRGLVCYNGGRCVPDPTKPDQEMCSCAPDWAGLTCKVPHVLCGNSTLSCMNGGECVLDETINDWFCACPPNLRGRQCQLGVMECKQGMFCMNNGRCSDDGLKCECPAGFFGIHCQNDERDAFADLIPRKKVPDWAAGLIALGALISVLAFAIIGLIFYRERRGRPVFSEWKPSSAATTGHAGALANAL